MQWAKLLSKDRVTGDGRFIPSTARPPGKRSVFEKDYDRIVYSPSFRRLQNKTQVHTLSHNDHVRNRLTHSLESSTLARSMGLRIGHWLRESKQEPIEREDIASCVQAAALAHDIGNPPFGHAGEYAIQRWFKKEADNGTRLSLSEEEKSDFLLFNGNAQGFRVLTRFSSRNGERGIQLTCAVLASFVKYPHSFKREGKKGKDPGLFWKDAELYGLIAERLHIPKLSASQNLWARHPLVFLVEAADDAAYLTADIEDGVELGLISVERAIELFAAFLQPAERERLTVEYESLYHYRSKAIGKLMTMAIAEFQNSYEAIMLGAHQRPLLDPEKNENIAALRTEAKASLFSCPDKLRRELAGKEALEQLLRRFARTTCPMREARWDFDRLEEDSPDAWRLLQLTERRVVGGGVAPLKGNARPQSEYEMLHFITDFIVGQTDRYAVELLRSLDGLEI
jgi:dGTPase